MSQTPTECQEMPNGLVRGKGQDTVVQVGAQEPCLPASVTSAGAGAGAIRMYLGTGLAMLPTAEPRDISSCMWSFVRSSIRSYRSTSGVWKCTWLADLDGSNSPTELRGNKATVAGSDD